jgi:succinyl-diaminopimelate desuccinylase
MLTIEELFLQLLRFHSITPHEGGSFSFIRNYLSDFELIEVNIETTKNLFLYKKFGNGAHLCFAGHVDVVPAGEGWQSDPFEPVVKEGLVYARGAQDMKSGVAASVQALKNATSFEGTLSLLLTSDEEGDATYGTVEMLKELQRRNLLPDYAIVAEPTSENVFGDALKIGRRGSINGVIEIFGKQGHAAYPEKAINPVHQIAPLLNRLAGHHFDEGDEAFSPSQIVITDIRGGMEVTNVTPGQLKIMFNVRNSTKTDLEAIRTYVQDVLSGLEYKLRLSESARAFLTCKDSKIVSALQRALVTHNGFSPKLSTAGGTSDARFFGSFGVATVECGVVNDTIHAPNERCSMHEVEALTHVFQNVIENFSKD